MGKPSKKVLCVLLSVILFLTLFQGMGVKVVKAADEYDTLRERRKTILTGGTGLNLSDPDIAARVSSMNTTAQNNWDTMIKTTGRTYLWSDLSSLASNSLQIESTYARLKLMAYGYATEGCALKGNASLKADIISGLDFMYTNYFNSSKTEYYNQWAWEIGIPLQLLDACAIMYNDLTTTQINNWMAVVDYFSPNPTKVSWENPTHGANRVWICSVVAMRGIIGKNSAKITAARDAISDVYLYVTSGDGFYKDGSYIQHVRHPYTGGYGAAIIYDLSYLVYLLSNSTWQVKDVNSKNIYNFVYDSFEPIIYKGANMDMVRGREMSRQGYEDHVTSGKIITGLMKIAQSAPAADAARIKSMVKYWIQEDNFRNYVSAATLIDAIITAKSILNDSGVAPRGELIKYKQYPNMDRAVKLGPGYGFGISMFSSRIYNFEKNGSEENLKGWHAGDGMTYLYNSDLGQFSGDFWPTVDPQRLPGTTVVAGSTFAERLLSSKSWVGGTDILDTYGVTGMDFQQSTKTLTAKKSWFAFDDEIVCLGAGISSTDNTAIETIVENRKLNSSGNNALTVNGTAKSTALGWSETIGSTNWVHLAGSVAGSDIGYYFPTAATINAKRENRTGTWRDINTIYGDTVTKSNNFLTMWFNHGNNPSNQTYAYALLPGKTSAQVSSYASNPQFAVIENSTSAQSVKDTVNNITGVNFWNDAIKTSGLITSNKKASVMMKETGSILDVSVSDPTMLNTGMISIEINRTGSLTVSRDSEITITQLSPTIKFDVNVNGAKGKSFKAQFNIGTALGAFDESGGMLVMEAENYHSKVNRGEQLWSPDTTYDGYSGAGTMFIGPDRDKFYGTGYSTASPQMEYSVNFNTAGTYYVWLRGYGENASADSVHVGLDGIEVSTSANAQLSTGAYGWSGVNTSSARLTLSISTPGIHKINVWAREDSARIDKILLSISSSYTPTGTGPAENGRVNPPPPPTTNGNFAESGGLVVMEAENYHFKADRGGKTWSSDTAYSGYSGTGTMFASPDSGTAIYSGYSISSSQMYYNVTFSTTGTYYVWLRGYGADGNGDSVHIGLEGAEVSTAANATITSGAYGWTNTNTSGAVLTINVPKAGAYTINLWMREDGARVDKILLNTSTSYIPTGTGPAESARVAPPGNFRETGGMAVMEAENYFTKVDLGGKVWSSNTAYSGYSGTGTMFANPDSGTAIYTGYSTSSPQMDYNVTFSTTGTYYLWLRGYGADGNGDSVHIGLDGAEVSTAANATVTSGAYGWTNTNTSGAVLTINVSTAGAHTINLWMREDGTRVDKILLNTSSSYTPTGTGPAETL